MTTARINRADFLRDPASALELARKGKVEVVCGDGSVRMTLDCPVLDDHDAKPRIATDLPAPKAPPDDEMARAVEEGRELSQRISEYHGEPKRLPLTADAGCKRCSGTGVVEVLVPTWLKTRGLCSCVRAE